MMGDLFSQSSAVISQSGLYRYQLFRSWGVGPLMGFIMLNPSTADAEQDDPTIRRCIGFARREGCGGLLVGNLFAYRATSPEDMASATDPVGRWNDESLSDISRRVAGPLVAAWGAHWMAGERGQRVADRFGNRLLCLGKTKGGSPRHPLYVRADAELVPL